MSGYLRHAVHARDAFEFWRLIAAGLWEWIRPSRDPWP